MAGRVRQVIFRIFYSTSFTIVFLLTVAFCCTGPIDAIYQSYRRGRVIDIFILSGVYALTALASIFLYASRLYTNRSVLKDIPKTYLPIEKAELPRKRVWRLIEDCKSRSVVIAYQARPRARRIENELPHARQRINTLLKPEHSKNYHVFEPQWGVINHPGWSSPAATELPNLQYGTVVAELTDLIEARAVSLAPVCQDNVPDDDDDGAPMVNEYAVEALQRPEEAGMRQYIAQLISLGVIEDNALSVGFLTLYERARFAPDPLSEDEFKTLMRMFAEVLRTMKTLDMDRLDVPEDFFNLHDLNGNDSPGIKGKQPVPSSMSSLAASDAGSVRHYASPNPPRMSDDSVRSFTSHDGEHEHEADASSLWTAPTSRPPFLHALKSANGSRSVSRNLSSRNTNYARSGSSRLRTRLGDLRNRTSYESNDRDDHSSLGSLRSSNSGSVIRLRRDYDGSRDDLPFEIIVPDVYNSARQGSSRGVSGPPT
ncbi:hypothetical protein H2198_002891 [Neophaeococcomyces mojaviensis]|uniref:Uncharacterized protein n=1 Tax=Neophaeococcomyces mojaviensis TaxID=3383035 RepID=A0ACC3ADB1_9EURO|nr:hypothetical protein H2198_002891 [Knufia sp. JES_112]